MRMIDVIVHKRDRMELTDEVQVKLIYSRDKCTEYNEKRR